MTSITIGTIPSELRARNQWVVWRYVQRGSDKPTKVPFQLDGTPASSTDLTTWITFGEVLEATGFDGIGFVFADDDPYIGIDLDDSIGDDSKLKAWGKKLVDRFATYTEISPSSKGVKLWVRGKYPSAGTGKRVKYRDGGVEMYHRGRYFTVTGKRYPDTPAEITEQQSGIDGLFEHILCPPKREKPAIELTERCVRYLERCPDAVSGDRGHDKTFHAACVCFRFGLSDAEIWRVMDWYNGSKCSPPWSGTELAHKIDDASKEVLSKGETGVLANTIEPPRVPLIQPPKESSALETRLKSAITGERTNIAWPWSALTRLARALVPGSLTLLCGAGGSSKSLLMSEACLHWLRDDVPFAVFHLEEDREFHELRAMAQLDERSELTHDEWQHENPDETLSAYDRYRVMLDRFGKCIWDAPASDVSLLDLEVWVRERATAGCRVIAVDPVTAADSGDRPWMADRRFVLNTKRILRESGASLIVVTHPRDGNPKHGSRMDNHAGGQAYNRFSSCVLEMQACKPVVKTIIDRTVAGTIRSQMEVNRVLHLHKTRSGTGSGWDIGYWFEKVSLRFAERGVIDD